ncbi:MAG: flagellar filament capping protein FliD [Planctomycetes bacterium]|nr:flagellar filament capping protein FliD [Planctomycetota bacterium]
MSSIRTGTGLISGINFAQIVDQLTLLQRAPIVRLELRLFGFQAVDSGLKTLEANLLSITTSIQSFGSESRFNTFQVDNSGSAQISVTANENAIPGTYRFGAVQKSTTFQSLSKGFVNADQQTLGPGTLTIATGGGLHQPTLLDALNNGNGIGRGTIRITDRAGNSADIDLTTVYTVDDVLEAINSNNDLSVTAAVQGDHFIITDTSGASASNLIVEDLGGGSAAADLGIVQSVASDTLTGNAVYTVTGDFTLTQINDGNGIHLLKGAPDISITLSDDTVLEVNLDDAATLNGVLDKINNHADNGGKLSATLVNGHLELKDLSGGGGAGVFKIENINNSSVVRQLGLDTAASGNTITGKSLVAGLNSVLLRNLRGGQGIDQLGSISLTDRTGTTAIIDLSTVDSLDQVLNAINSATSSDGTKLQLTARINSIGTGIEIVDTSGSTTSNLIISDVGSSTLAAQLGIAVDAAQTSVDSGNLALRYVNEATSIANYAPDGGMISPGSFLIVDSAGNEAVIDISSAVQTLGDVLLRINAVSEISVRAELNATGDGFVLIDEAAGSNPLRVEELGGTTAADLRLLGDAVLGGDNQYRISSRSAAVIDLTAEDTLNDLVEKINDLSGFVSATVFNDGSAFNSHRLSLTSTKSGLSGGLIIDDGGLGFQFDTIVEAQDALLLVGDSPETGFLVPSKNNNYENVITGLDVTILQTDTEIAEVTVSREFSKIEKAIQSFVKSYNTFAASSTELSKFDPETERRGVLQGKGIVFRIQNRLNSLINNRGPSSTGSINSLVELGVQFDGFGKLKFDETRLAKQLEENPQAVADFFLTEQDGFADRAEALMESLTDPLTGTITLEKNSIQASSDALIQRIALLDELLEQKRERLLRQFITMESIISTLTAQQDALSLISPLQIIPVRK